ncbi:hypothetical protein [Rhodococcus sp. H29-C3]|uniref:hypothetical protein n=1 Tax=Rhodococcus sp. H29-C3 TaxID=3046307 RepID=UPI0024BAC560|nr:hypothetical protein [Rhodococcus sp. H29-C3]MDJ0363191.1 hypothetical protein [Rhodococcus sp. H29-C3]
MFLIGLCEPYEQLLEQFDASRSSLLHNRGALEGQREQDCPLVDGIVLPGDQPIPLELRGGGGKRRLLDLFAFPQIAESAWTAARKCMQY